jgi:hypothetical protein
MKLAELENTMAVVEPLQKELQEKNIIIGQLRHDILQLQTHLNEAMKFMKQGSSEDSVDRYDIRRIYTF